MNAVLLLATLIYLFFVGNDHYLAVYGCYQRQPLNDFIAYSKYL